MDTLPRRHRRSAWGLQNVPWLLLALLIGAPLHASDARPSEAPAPSSTTNDVGEDPCATAGCDWAVNTLAKTMNFSADPCEDFFSFVCGGYVKETPLPSRGWVSVVSQMSDGLRLQVEKLLSEAPRRTEPAAFGKAKTLYQSCMNTTLLEELGLEPVRTLIAELGGWPLLEGDRWNESHLDWQALNYKLIDKGLHGSPLFGVGVDIDILSTSRHSMTVGTPDLRLELKGLDEASSKRRVQHYVMLLSETVQLLRGAPGLTPNDTMNINDIISLERELDENTASLEKRFSWPNLTAMNVSALQRAYPYVSWLELMRRLLPAGANITEAANVNVLDPTYMSALGTILAKKDKRVVANYLVWRALDEHVLPYLNAKARAIFKDDSRLMSSTGLRSDVCVKLVQHSMRLVTSAMYARRFSSEATRLKAVQMVHDIRTEMDLLLKGVDWMDSTSRDAAVLKAEMMKFSVAYPSELLNDTLLDEYFRHVDIHPGRLLDNVLALNKDSLRHANEDLEGEVKRQDWTSFTGWVDIVNAFYFHAQNSMSIPAGLMQGAFFQPDRPSYMNYGGLGFVIGHEVSHGFDAMGGLFDKLGNKVNWWDKKTKKLFDDKVGCIVQFYNEMRNEQLNISVNGELTQGENIADTAGLKLAYRAYRRHTQLNGAEDSLTLRVNRRVAGAKGADGGSDRVETRTLTLKPRQLFWVSAASLWCSKETPAELNRLLRTSPHPPGPYRVNGALMNQKAFAEDFQCPEGSRMSPVHKCLVW